jgi:imidazole glycerol-phosphate synthase subunit HisF
MRNKLPRIIPVLLLQNGGLYKTTGFKNPKYIGDPLNAVKIFNDKEVDELIFLDINATAQGKKPDTGFLKEIASECFMPLCYGGGINSISDIKSILKVGVEKISMNSSAHENPLLVKEAADQFGSSAVVISMDVKKNFFGKYELYTQNGNRKQKTDPVEFAVKMSKLGAGELLVNSIDRDGTLKGFDVDLIRSISSSVDIPVIACGGAGNLADIKTAVKDGGASAAAAGSLFVFHGKHRAVLINYPSQAELKEMFT